MTLAPKPHIIGSKQEPTEDEKFLSVLSMMASFRQSVQLAIDEAKEVLKSTSLDPYASEAIHTYALLLERGFKEVKAIHARVLMRASKAYLKQMHNNLEKVRQVIEEVLPPEVDDGNSEGEKQGA